MLISLPADVLWGECVTNEPQRTSAGRLNVDWLIIDGQMTWGGLNDNQYWVINIAD